MTTLTITYIIGTNNVGADDDEIELIDAYRAEVQERLIETFPGANVVVEIAHGNSKALVEGVDDEQAAMTLETVTAIANEVWNHGNWHNAPWPPVGFGATETGATRRGEHDQSA